MPSTNEHARLVIEQLARRRRPDGTIASIASVDLIEACGYNPGHYAKAYGQAISLLDATCLLQDLPWLGRLVVFKNAKDDLPGPWAPWRAHMPEIVAAPLRKRWSADELNRISAALPSTGADAWWREHEPQSHSLLE